jgi:very-short-patch-repair endonuclease
MTNSSWEDYFEIQIHEAGLPKPEREYKFLKNRRFRFDFCWPDILFAVEIDGNIFHKSRHTTGAGYSRDCEKFALAACEGYRVIRVTTGQVSKGEAIAWVKEYFRRQIDV